MPIISMFFGIIIRMYHRDHNPPHIHADSQGHKAIISLNGEVISVKPLSNYRLLVEFDNQEKRIYDMADKLYGVFDYLKDINAFNRVTIVSGAITWFRPNKMELDLCPDTVYMESFPYQEDKNETLT